MPTFAGIPVEQLDDETLERAYCAACTYAHLAAQEHDLNKAETNHVFARHILAVRFEREAVETSEGKTVN